MKQDATLPLLDALKPVTIRNSRWRCDHGWDIDLDDGSTNYVITNNLCLNGGIKNREGFHRLVENNVMVNSSFHPHVWPSESQDIVRRNILFDSYKPAIMPKTAWGKELDYNLVHQIGRTKPQPAAALQAQSGRDEHSIMADALFVDPVKGDFRVRAGSPALALGFKNFPMDQFGVQKPALKMVARTPSFNYSPQKQSQRNGQEKNWLGAKVRNIVGEGEMSAYGTPGETGVLVLEVPAGGALDAAGLKKDDVILKLDDWVVDQCSDLLRRAASQQPGREIKIGIQRTQTPRMLTVKAHSM